MPGLSSSRWPVEKVGLAVPEVYLAPGLRVMASPSGSLLCPASPLVGATVTQGPCQQDHLVNMAISQIGDQGPDQRKH